MEPVVPVATNSNFKLILVNDHSDDDSEKLAQEYQLIDNRIKTIRNQGNGIIDALNTGAKIAEGNFINQVVERTNGGRLCFYGNVSSEFKTWAADAGFEPEYYDLVDGYVR